MYPQEILRVPHQILLLRRNGDRIQALVQPDFAPEHSVRVGARTKICHNLIFCLIAPVTLHNPHTDRLAAQRWIHEVHDQEGVAFLGNVRAVLTFQLVLRLIGAEMHHALTDPAQARVVFSARCLHVQRLRLGGTVRQQE